mmetsp:Transcript_56196/g.146507  ORF Transcript_56196/g.146507 Transcript_56196/m.146507 type:complete len:356 (+) Transcript_56196:1377-2444(+)
MPSVLELWGLVVGQLAKRMERRVPDPRMRVIHVRQQQLGHLVHVLRLLHILHGLLHCRECCELGLPSLLRGKLGHQLEEGTAHGLHAHRLYNTVDGLLAVVVELVAVLLALLVVHSLHPCLELVLPSFDLEHQVHAALQREWGERGHAFGEPLGLLLCIGHQPLQRQVADALLAALSGLHQGRKQLCWLHASCQLLLEEVGLDRGDLQVVLQAFLQLILQVCLAKLLEHLGQHARRGHQGSPCLLFQDPDQLADEDKRGTADLRIAVRQGILHDTAELLLGLDNLVLVSGDYVLQQSDGGFAQRCVGVGRSVCQSEGRGQELRPAPLARGQPAPLVVLLASCIRKFRNHLADLLL